MFFYNFYSFLMCDFETLFFLCKILEKQMNTVKLNFTSGFMNLNTPPESSLNSFGFNKIGFKKLDLSLDINSEYYAFG